MSRAKIRSAAAHAWQAGIAGDWDTALARLNGVAHLDGAAPLIVAGFADTLAVSMRERGIPGPPDGIAWLDLDGPARCPCPRR